MSAPRRGMVTSPHRLASEAGLGVLRDGGNAVEAAIATAAALSVLYPHMTGIGGDAFWLIAEPGAEPVAVSGCGAAGVRVNRDLYGDAIPQRGPLAANTVAGALSSWDAALRVAPGKLSHERLLRDAVTYARDGAPVAPSLASNVAAKRTELSSALGWSDVFANVAEGQTLRLTRFARTLERLADDGFDSFYRGALAADVAADLRDVGAPIDEVDLERHEATTETPLTVRIDGARLFNSRPPTQGFASLLILALFDRIAPRDADGFEHVHALVEATKAAFRIRDREIFDPAAMNFDPQALLNDATALDAMAATISRSHAAPWPDAGGPSDTTWFGAIDSDGRAVSVIQSIYFEFGSGVVLPRTGILWQNRGASFRLSGTWNALAPGRKPFHTLNPALARFDDGRVLTYGAMGGEGQPQFQAALFTRYARYGQSLQAAIDAPRWLLGKTWGDDTTALRIEDRFGADVIDRLATAGHRVERALAFTDLMGHAGAIVRNHDGDLEGASDPRSDGGIACW